MVLVFILSLTGLLLLVLAFLLPQGSIENNVKRSATIFEESGSYPIAETRCESEMDYFTDALILLEAANQHSSSVLDRALMDYRISGSPVPTLVEFANSNKEFDDASYARYWHGYLIYVKPLLCFFSYGTIRKIGVVLQSLLVGLILWRLIKNRRPLVALGFWLGYVTVSIKAIGYCLQYWPATFAMLIASLAIVVMWEKKTATIAHLSLLFAVTGAAVNYFDFLTFPLVSLTIPLLLLFALEGLSDSRRVLRTFILCALSWGFAYGFMWILKWLFATVLTGRNVFADAASQAKYRSMFTESGESVSYVVSLLSSFKRYINNSFVVSVGAFAAFSIVCLGLNEKTREEKLRTFAKLALPAAVALVFVLLWFLGMLEHSWHHVQIANHNFWTLGFGLSLLAASVIEALYRGVNGVASSDESKA